MSWTDMLTLTIAAVSALECIAGRLAALDWRRHRHNLLLGYLLATGVCILAASLIWQGLDPRLLDWATWGIAAHLVLSWRDWRHGAPENALQRPAGRPITAVMPSRIDPDR